MRERTAVVVLAEGFETIEGLTPVDVLRRAGVEVITLGLGDTRITSAQGVTVEADRALADYTGTPDAVVLPGGLPGADHLGASPAVEALVARVGAAGGLRAAICAAPARALARFGALEGIKATCYPGFEGELPESTLFVDGRVVDDHDIITSRGPGTALEFSIHLAERLMGAQMGHDLREGLIAHW